MGQPNIDTDGAQGQSSLAKRLIRGCVLSVADAAQHDLSSSSYFELLGLAMKSRGFSIYLLKPGFDESNALVEEHTLDEDVAASALPEGASLYVLDSDPYPPWWKSYFEIEASLTQVSKGALVFLPVGERQFVLSFGHVSHYLRDTSYEYDFGLKVTLNSVDARELRGTDSLDPGVGRRQRTQLPIGSDLTLFEFDRDSSILRRLTGKVKSEYKELFKHATGASNLRISSGVQSGQLIELCEDLLKLYESSDYQTTFPDIQNIAPIRDPELVEKLNGLLVASLQKRDDALALVVPDLINYDDEIYASFRGAGPALIYDDIFIGRYYEYLESHDIEAKDLDLPIIKKHKLVLTTEDGSPRDAHTIFKSLIFDAQMDGGSYHLCEGNWYRVEPQYVARLAKLLDPLCSEIELPPYTHSSEGAYNNAVAADDAKFVCLDETNISPAGHTAIEPCDLYSADAGYAVFTHLKVSTLSSKLSHLFNQGTNSIEVLRSEEEARTKLAALIEERASAECKDALLSALKGSSYSVRFVMITHKDPSKKSLNLPLFSRISLMRNMRALQIRGVRAAFGFVKDDAKKKSGTKKARSSGKKAKPGSEA